MAENIFELLKTNFYLDLFLEKEGFEFFPKESKKISNLSQSNLDGFEYKAYKEMQGTSTLSILLVSKNPNGHYVYNNPNDSSDNGTVIDYLMKHKGMDWKDIAKFARDSNIELPETIKTKHSPTRKVDHSTPPEIIDVQDYRPNSYYKNDRQVEDTINANAYIKDAIKFVKFSRKKQDGKIQFLFGEAFPIKNHKGETMTYNMKSRFFKRGMFLSERKNGIWYAIPERTPQTFIIGEAAIDVISYYKHLGTKKPIGLISTEGRFSRRYADEFTKLVPNINHCELILVNDNDVHGFHYDLAWIGSLCNLPYSVGTRKFSPDETFIRIESPDPQLAEELSQYKQEDHLLKPDQIVQAIKHIKNKYQIKNILIHKSPFNDWNQKIVADEKKNGKS
jgi:hypothetical protein